MSDNKERGLYGKYYVERRDGKPLKGDMAIVLEIGDPNAWPALMAWAETVREKGYKKLAHDIERYVKSARAERVYMEHPDALEEPKP